MGWQKEQQAYKKRKQKASDSIGGNPYVMLRKDLLLSNEFIELSPSAKNLLLDLMAQYNGSNNGNLSLAFDGIMKPRGWNSRTTLSNARHELLEKGFLIVSQRGQFRGQPNLYALTIFNFDDCLKKSSIVENDFKPTRKPRDDWKNQKFPSTKNA